MNTSSLISTNAGLALIRLMLGAVFVFHGSQKLFGAFDGPGLEGATAFMESLGLPWPTLNALLASVTEFVGGLALVSGWGLRLAAIPLTFTMLVAAFTVHGGGFSAQSGGMEYPLTLALVTAGLGLTGPGAWVLGKVRSVSVSAQPATGVLP